MPANKPPTEERTFTPGPWRALDKSVTLDTKDLSCLGAIATCHVRRTAQPLIMAADARANATLIAASPDLYDALKWAFDHMPVNRFTSGWFNVAAGALAKAEGRSAPEGRPQGIPPPSRGTP